MSTNDEREEKADISNLQENFCNQQKKLSALKEMLRKSEVTHGKSNTTAREKVKNIAERLTNLKSKARRGRKNLDVANVQNISTASDTTEYQTTDSGRGSVVVETVDAPPFAQHSFTDPATDQISANPSPVVVVSNSGACNVNATHQYAGSEKFQLLRQQMEHNKLRMAQRASSKQHLEQLVTQLKEKFDSTQQCLEDTSELGRSMNDLSALQAYKPCGPSSSHYERHRSVTDLSAPQPFNLERERYKFLENRCRLLEKQLEKEKEALNNSRLNESALSQATTKHVKELENKILELEEALSVTKEIEIENVHLKNELSLKEKITINLDDNNNNKNNNSSNKNRAEDEIAEYDAMELAGEENAVRLKQEIRQKTERCTELETINANLEAERCKITAEIKSYQHQVSDLKQQLQLALEKLKNAEDSLLILKTNTLECGDASQQDESLKVMQEDIVAAIPTNTDDIQIKAEMAKQIRELQQEQEELRERNHKLEQLLAEQEKLEVSDATIADKICDLEATIESQREDLEKCHQTSQRFEEELMEKTIELNVVTANFKVLEEKLHASNKNKPLFMSTAEETAAQNPELLAENQQLKQKLDEANKAMIKLKLKFKHTEKQIEKIKKTTDLHSALVRLEEEKEHLQQKIIELEDEKGQWQLQQVGSDLATEIPESERFDWQAECKLKTETIRLLEQQNFEYTEKLAASVQKQETVRVSSEICALQLEEQLAEERKLLESLRTEMLEKDVIIAELQQKLKALLAEKEAVDKKLEHYVSENIELLGKMEKLSKSSSSAESIEIVERLTQQECAEIDKFNKRW